VCRMLTWSDVLPGHCGRHPSFGCGGLLDREVDDVQAVFGAAYAVGGWQAVYVLIRLDSELVVTGA
jgi:hypothetical protein